MACSRRSDNPFSGNVGKQNAGVARRPSVRLLYILLLLAIIVVSQETKWASIPSSHDLLLWESVAVAFAAWFVLRSGWGRPERHAAEQRAMGTVANTFYPPRREGITMAVTLIGGLLGGMWWGATAWLPLVQGMQRKAAGHALVNLEISVLVGVLAGGMVGAAAGLTAGEVWERSHRRRRLARHPVAPES